MFFYSKTFLIFMADRTIKKIKDLISYQFLFFSILFLITVSTPFYHTFITKRVSLDNPVDPEYINGLLTVTSILFGFSSILVFQQRKEREWLKFVLLIPLVFIGFSGGSIWNVVVGINKPMMALLWTWTSVLVSIFVTWFLAGYAVGESHSRDESEN